MAKESKSFFWASYADLMTSLFFVMLTLFIVVIIALNNARIDAIEQTAELQAKIDKADEINNATRELDTQHSQYFQYFPEFKKHKLAVTVNFRSGSADMNSLPSPLPQISTSQFLSLKFNPLSSQNFLRDNAL